MACQDGDCRQFSGKIFVSCWPWVDVGIKLFVEVTIILLIHELEHDFNLVDEVDLRLFSVHVKDRSDKKLQWHHRMCLQWSTSCCELEVLQQHQVSHLALHVELYDEQG